LGLRGSVFTEPLLRNGLHNPVVLLLRTRIVGCLSSHCLAMRRYVSAPSIRLFVPNSLTFPSFPGAVLSTSAVGLVTLPMAVFLLFFSPPATTAPSLRPARPEWFTYSPLRVQVLTIRELGFVAVSETWTLVQLYSFCGWLSLSLQTVHYRSLWIDTSWKQQVVKVKLSLCLTN
jgi:hypothetical protein